MKLLTVSPILPSSFPHSLVRCSALVKDVPPRLLASRRAAAQSYGVGCSLLSSEFVSSVLVWSFFPLYFLMIYAIVALSLYLPKIPFLPIISADFTHEGSHPPAPPNPPDPPPHSEEFCPCSRGHRRGNRCSETSSSIFPRPSTRQEWHSSPSSSTRHRGFGASPQSATDAMSLLAWNCQGVGGSLDSAKMRHLARLISSTDAQVPRPSLEC